MQVPFRTVLVCIVLTFNYILKVNGVKLTHILLLLVCVCICVCTRVFWG